MAQFETAYDEMLAKLRKEREGIVVELEKVDKAIESIEALVDAELARLMRLSPSPERSVSNAEPVSNSKATPKYHYIATLPMPQAVYEALRVTRKEMVAREIAEFLIAQGLETESEQPEKRAQDALRRRERSHGDVCPVGWGKWGLREWYDDFEWKKIQAVLGGQPGRDREAHSEKTKRGIRKAIERGARYGAPPKITPEQWELALNLVKAGETNIAELRRQVSRLTPAGVKPISASGMQKYAKMLFKLEPYPAQWKQYFDNLKASADEACETPSIRVVK